MKNYSTWPWQSAEKGDERVGLLFPIVRLVERPPAPRTRDERLLRVSDWLMHHTLSDDAQVWGNKQPVSRPRRLTTPYRAARFQWILTNPIRPAGWSVRRVFAVTGIHGTATGLALVRTVLLAVVRTAAANEKTAAESHRQSPARSPLSWSGFRINRVRSPLSLSSGFVQCKCVLTCLIDRSRAHGRFPCLYVHGTPAPSLTSWAASASAAWAPFCPCRALFSFNFFK